MNQEFPHFEAASARSAGGPGRLPVPLDIRTDGVHLGKNLEAHLLSRTRRWLGRRAGHLDRATIRLVDVNGPRGGVDAECRIELVPRGSPPLFVSKRGDQARFAFDRALDAARVALERVLRGRGAPRQPTDVEERSVRPTTEAGLAPRSLIGRREGRGRVNLLQAAERPEKHRRDVPVDTSRPGTSASDRRVGNGSTASRNTKLRAPKATVMLEDSAQGRPSRKSTRRSSGRSRPDNPLYLSKRRGLRRP